ncbi:MAG TPA: hypothetical protein EYG53_04400 [Gammaproteobacteria bacterium]|nr:hypothetical protein [Gammaproteobacteria bacterium]
MNAFVAKGRTHTLVGLSSGAVMKLSEGELEFVIGHELGHSIFSIYIHYHFTIFGR